MPVPTRPRERLRVELGAMRPDWNRWCMRRGLTSSEGVRQLIAAALETDVNHDADKARAETEVQWLAIGEPRTRIAIKLTHSELKVVEQRAAMSGLNRNRWIVALIRAQLMREPQLGLQELRLLSDSNQQLAVISRWLGQLAREVSAKRLPPTGECDIGAVRNQIDVHLRVVSAVIRSNLDRWSR